MNYQMWAELISHMTPMELVFCVLSMTALSVTTHSWRDAHIDSAILSAAKLNGPRRVVADNNIQQEQLRFGLALLLTLTSWSFLVLSPPPPQYNTLPQTLVGLGSWNLVAIIVTASSLIDKSIRKRLQRYAPIEVQTNSTTIQPAPEPEKTAKGHEADALMKRVEEVREEASHDKERSDDR